MILEKKVRILMGRPLAQSTLWIRVRWFRGNPLFFGKHFTTTSPSRRYLELWVLRSTFTLKTTDTTLVSVDGNIGHRGALVPLPHASPESITEETPTGSATVPLSHTDDTIDVGSRDRQDFGRDRAQDQVLAQEYATAALQY